MTPDSLQANLRALASRQPYTYRDALAEVESPAEHHDRFVDVSMATIFRERVAEARRDDARRAIQYLFALGMLTK